MWFEAVSDMAAFRVQTVSPVGGSHHPLALLADILALFSISELWKKYCSDFKHNIFFLFKLKEENNEIFSQGLKKTILVVFYWF